MTRTIQSQDMLRSILWVTVVVMLQ
ncbi:MAG: hypothetical protein XE05_1423, partial [Thermotogales bacterium 46_20]